MDLYHLHNKPHTLKHHDIAHDHVPKLILGRYGSNKAALKEREHKIAKDPEAAVQYAIDILMDKFPEAEPYILTNAKAAERYARAIRGPWKEAEDIIATDSWASYSYAANVLNGPFPKGEDAILTDVENTHFYNDVILNDARWKAREKKLLADKNALELVSYAYRIIKGPWKEAEPIIATDAMASFDYALDVLKKRFPAGEKAIYADSHYAALYDKHVANEKEGHQWISRFKRLKDVK